MTVPKKEDPKEVSVVTEGDSDESEEEPEYDYKGKLEWLGDQVTELKATLAEERALREAPPTNSTDSTETGDPDRKAAKRKRLKNPFQRRRK